MNAVSINTVRNIILGAVVLMASMFAVTIATSDKASAGNCNWRYGYCNTQDESDRNAIWQYNYRTNTSRPIYYYW